MNIPDIPEQISRTYYDALIRTLGFGELGNLRSLEFRTDGIYAEVMARNEDGRIVVDLLSNDTAMHRVYIPIVD